MELSKEMQELAVELVLDEKKKLASILKKSGKNSSYYRRYSSAHSEALYNLSPEEASKIKFNKRRLRLSRAFETLDSIGVPLAKTKISDETGKSYDVEFGRIDWYSVNPTKTQRTVSFLNDGTIEMTRTGLKQTLKHPSKLSCKASFSVLSPGFDFFAVNDKIVGDFDDNTDFKKLISDPSNHEYEHISISLQGDSLTITLNETSIDINLGNGIRTITEQGKTVTYPEGSCEQDKQIERRAIAVLKNFVNDIPVPGFVARINRLLEFVIDKKKLPARPNHFFNPGNLNRTEVPSSNETLFTEEELNRAYEEMAEEAEWMRKETQELFQKTIKAAREFIAK